MGWRESFQGKDFVTIGLSVAALVLSVTSWRAGVASSRHSSVNSQMQLYLSEYLTALDAEPLVFTQCGYARTTPRNRQHAQIVLGLLIGVVETMDVADDRRSRTWRARITDLKGPLYDRDWDPAAYAGTAHMAGEIGALRNGHLGNVDCTSSS